MSDRSVLFATTLIVGVIMGIFLYHSFYVQDLKTDYQELVASNEYKDWQVESLRNRITRLEEKIRTLDDKTYYDEIWVGKSPTNSFMAYLTDNETITILYTADTNHECINWALEHAAPGATIYLQYKVISGTIDLGLTEWSVTIK